MGKRLLGLATAAAVALLALTTTASAAGLTVDAGVATTPPSGPTSGQPVVLASTVSNHGPDQDTITFTDTVPTGLTITSAVAGDGGCSTTGQKVTCIISGLAAGQSAPVQVVVTPTAPGTYTNSVSVAVESGDTDPDTTNNSASATFLATSIPSIPLPTCIVPNLAGTPESVAEEVLTDLSCTFGVKKKHTGLVPKGAVIRTNLEPGGYPAGTFVRLLVSSGPIKHHSTKHH